MPHPLAQVFLFSVQNDACVGWAGEEGHCWSAVDLGTPMQRPLVDVVDWPWVVAGDAPGADVDGLEENPLETQEWAGEWE